MQLDQFKLAALAREIVMNVKTVHEVLKDYQITWDEYKEEVEPNPFFKKVFEQQIIEWNSVSSTKDRIKAQAQAGLEKALQPLGVRLMDPNESLNAQVETGKLFAKLGQLDTPKEGPTASERFTITINLGADEKVVIDQPKTPVQSPESIALKALTANEP
jgi:hypothetical protein